MIVCPFDQHPLEHVVDPADNDLVGVVLYAIYNRGGIHVPDHGKGITAKALTCPHCNFVALFQVADEQKGSAES